MVCFLSRSHMTTGAFLTPSSWLSLYSPSFLPQFDILPLCAVLYQQSIGGPLSGYCSCGNTSQSHHQGQKEELMYPSALASQSNPGVDGQHITGDADFWYISTELEKCYILHRCIFYTDLEFDSCRNCLHSTETFCQHLFYSGCKEIRTSRVIWSHQPNSLFSFYVFLSNSFCY